MYFSPDFFPTTVNDPVVAVKGQLISQPSPAAQTHMSYLSTYREIRASLSQMSGPDNKKAKKGLYPGSRKFHIVWLRKATGGEYILLTYENIILPNIFLQEGNCLTNLIRARGENSFALPPKLLSLGAPHSLTCSSSHLSTSCHASSLLAL